MSQLELAEDNWIMILSLLSTQSKLRSAQVCKQWRSLIMHPLFWKSVEVSLGLSKNLLLSTQYQCLINFITKYCPVLLDLHLTFYDHRDLPTNCDSDYASSELVYRARFPPTNTDLKVLNLVSVRMDKITMELLMHLPNLEELYLHRRSPLSAASLVELENAKKLQILYVTLECQTAFIVAACPSLKYLIFYGTEEFYDSSDDDEEYWRRDQNAGVITQVKNTIVVMDHVLNMTKIHNYTDYQDKWKLIEPLLVPYTYGLKLNPLVFLAFDFKKTKPTIEYLVKNVKFDLNSKYDIQYLYRPSFTFCNVYMWPRYGLKYQLEYLESYPIEAVITTGDPNDVAEMIKLGAMVECQEPNRSYLALAYSAKMRLVLLQHGADPNKSIDEKEYLPVYAYMFTDSRFEDSEEIVHALKDKCDLHVQILGSSLVQWSVRSQKWKSFNALRALGVKFSQEEMFTLLKVNPRLFVDLILNKNLNVLEFNTDIAIRLMQMELAPLIAPYINEYFNKSDEKGYTLFHYFCMAATNEQSVNFKGLDQTSIDAEKYRWLLTDPENCSWRSSQQKVIDIRKEHESVKHIRKEQIALALQNESEDDEDNEKEQSIYEKLRAQSCHEPEETAIIKFNLQSDTPVEIFAPDVKILTPTGETGLLLVCKSFLTKQETLRRVEELLKHDADFNLPDKFGWTPMHALCYTQCWNVAHLLLNNGANINVQDAHGVTPLMAAIYGFKRLDTDAKKPSSFTKHFIALIKASKTPVDVISLTEKFTNRILLHLAVSVPSSQLISELLSMNANINARDADGFTPLHLALMYGHNEVVETLVKNGADLNAQTNSLRLTPAMVLMQILSVLKTSKWASNMPSVPYFSYIETYNTMMRVRHCFRDIGEYSVSDAPWHYHSGVWYHGATINCDAMLELVTNGADLTLTDVNQNTYLHFLIILYGDNFSLKEWIARHESLNSLWNKRNDNNTSNFHLLCSQLGKTQVYSDEAFLFDIVQANNINVMECDGLGKFPFYFIASAQWQSFSWDRWAALPGVNLNARLPEQDIPDLFEVLWSEGRASLTMLKDMLNKTPSYLDRQSRSGETFFMKLIRQIITGDLQLEALEVILAYKSHLNIQDVNGNTALHMACKYFHLGAVDSIRSHLNNVRKSYPFFVTPFMLLEAGADPSISNARGETPLSYVPALMSHYQDVYKWIKAVAEKSIPDEQECAQEMDID